MIGVTYNRVLYKIQLKYCMYLELRMCIHYLIHSVLSSLHDDRDLSEQCPDSKVNEAYMGLIWDRQGPGGPHVVPMNLAIRVTTTLVCCCYNEAISWAYDDWQPIMILRSCGIHMIAICLQIHNISLYWCFCPWAFFENIGFNTVLTDPFVSHLATQLGYSAGEFQALQLIVLAAFGVVD